MTATHQVTGLSFDAARLEARRKSLGASEIAAVVGLNPYRTAVDVWMEKTGKVQPFAGNNFTEWGLRLEDAIAQKYGEAHGVELLRSETLLHPTEPWMSATPDRIVLRQPKKHGLEIKNKSARQAAKWGESGTDQVPHDIATQVHWSMSVVGFDRWDVCALFGGNEDREYPIYYDAEIAAGLIEAGRDFWFSHVLADIPPALDGSEGAHRFLAEKFSRHSDVMLEASREVENHVRALAKVRDQIKDAEFIKSGLEAQIKAAIGEAAGIQGGGWKATWKAPKSGAVSLKAIAEELGPTPELIEKHTG